MAQQRDRRVTLSDVAAAAGVSLKTASNVLNDNGRMKDATRVRVQEAIESLGYRVNVSARNLMRGRTGMITLAVPTLRAPYLSELAESVIDVARTLDYGVYVTTYLDDGIDGSRRFLEHFNAHVADGALLSMSEHELLSPEHLAVDFPLVCLGSRLTGDSVDRVTTDDRADADAVATHLLRSGSQRLAVIGAHRPFASEQIGAAVEGNGELRLRGIAEACERAGRPLDAALVVTTGYDWTIGDGFKAARALLEAGARFDAVICLNDALAIGAISALRESGIRIPDDVQVVGWDDLEESAYLEPPLTTVGSNIEWISRTAVELLIARIGGADGMPTTLRAHSPIVLRSTTR